MDWKYKNVFITGATGLLGSWLVDELLNKGANITILKRDTINNSRLYSSGKVNHINIVHGCLEDLHLLIRALNEHEIEIVFHLAAQAIVTTAKRSPISTFESNIKGSWNLLEACRVNELVKRVVIASSDKAYGIAETLPYDEKTKLQGRFPYDVSKSCADLIAQSYFHTYDLPVAIVRCGNIYGAGDLNFNRIVPGTIRSIILNEAPIIRSDGKFTRDYLYVKDAVNAYITLAENLDRKEIQGQAFNFSSEKPVSVLELVNIMLAASESSFEPVVLDQVKTEIPNQLLSCEKSKQLLNWTPKFDLQTGLKETFEGYNDFFKQSNNLK